MAFDAILTINPGSTTTRCAIYRCANDGVHPVAEETLGHSAKELAAFPSIAAQLGFRAGHVDAFLKARGQGVRLVAVAGRGGMLNPVPAGVIEVSGALVDFALHRPMHHHASNLGAALALRAATGPDARAFVVDPVSVDELAPVARMSGFDDIPRSSFVHALNIRASGRCLARDMGKHFDDLRAVIAHLGAGFSIAALQGGRLVDSSNRTEMSPFTPERAGGLPPLPLIELCYSGRYSRDALLAKLYGGGGVFGMLGTKDMVEVEAMVDAGDDRASLVYDAMLYQVTKAIGAMAAVAEFDLDAIVLTGGLAQSARVTTRLSARLSRLAPVHVHPGSDECRALAEGAWRVLTGMERPMSWTPPQAEILA